MLSIGKRRTMTPKLWFVCLLLVITACSPKSPQAVSTPLSPTGENLVDPTATSAPAATLEQDTPTALAVTASPKATASPIQGFSQGFPDPSAYRWDSVVEGLSLPLGIANAGDGSGRLFLVLQDGVIRIVQNGALLETPFLDIRQQVGRTGNEQGLLGLAFHPGYIENGFFYLNYTDRAGNTIIARYQVSNQDANLANPDSEKILLTVSQPYANHNGGGVVFGPDGYLYLSLGDGGSGGDPQGNGQSTETLLGKILRLDVNQGDPYGIPADNPFISGGGRPEIWLYGLRNPWRFSFDRTTGDLWIGDVGQDKWEEVDFLPAGHPGGENLGWNFKEGTHTYQGTPPQDLVDPVFEYDHSQGCSISGGFVYRGGELPEWQGIYLFADFCTGNVWGTRKTTENTWETQLLFQNVGSITSFGEDENGEIYLVSRDGRLLKLSHSVP
jgi:glucose/arabinose dehydrogenase